MKIGGYFVKSNNVTLLQKMKVPCFLLIIVNYLRKNPSDK